MSLAAQAATTVVALVAAVAAVSLWRGANRHTGSVRRGYRMFALTALLWGAGAIGQQAPRLVQVERQIQRQAGMVNPHWLAVLVGIAVQGRAVGAEGETVAPLQHAEIVVVGMVFLHQDHDVVDAGQAVAAGRPVRKRKGSGTARVGPPSTVNPRFRGYVHARAADLDRSRRRSGCSSGGPGRIQDDHSDQP